MKNKKRKKRVTPDQKLITSAIVMLIQGKSLRYIAMKLGVQWGAIKRIADKYKAQIEEKKKENREKIIETQGEKYKNFLEGCLDVARRGIEHITDEKLKQGSAPQIATTVGICVDKFNVGMGNPTEILEVKLKTRADMLGYITGQKPKENPPTRNKK
jgi:hypothetical protein